MIVDELQVEERVIFRSLDKLFRIIVQSMYDDVVLTTKPLEDTHYKGLSEGVWQIISSLREPHRTRAVDFIMARYLAFWEKMANRQVGDRPIFFLFSAGELLRLGGSQEAIEAVLRAHADNGNVREACAVAENYAKRDLNPAEVSALVDGYVRHRKGCCDTVDEDEVALVGLVLETFCHEEALEIKRKILTS